MSPQLLHIYGPLYVHSYGLAIAIGLLVFVFLCQRDARLKILMNAEQFSNVVVIGIMSALLGGRLWFLISEWSSIDSVIDLAKPWVGGLSVLGSIVGVLTIVPWYLYRRAIPVLAFFDIVALYAPLLQAISRLGCFFAGCCYGLPTYLSWGVTYYDHMCMAPLHVSLHPTQLYSSFLLALLYGILYALHRHVRKGQLLMAYLIGAGIERFIVDIFRDDRVFYANSVISINQMLATLFIVAGSIGFYNLKRR